MNDLHPVALFRLSVLGPLVSRDTLARGELKQLIRELAGRDYDIPGSERRGIGEKTIEAWFYAWRRGGIEALTPKPRSDRGRSKLALGVQQAILDAKRDNPRRSIDQLIALLEHSGQAPRGTVPRSSVHRLLQCHGLSRPPGAASEPEEHRSYEAHYAGDIWYGDVMHGPRVPVQGRMRKVYLVSLMDDASRLLTHSAFCTGEKALDIEGVLKQAVLKRGLPRKLVVDNGPAYRARTLQGICARLGIHLIYCRPYAPQGKGKLERWHRTVRDQFLSELDPSRIQDLSDLNARLWAWLEGIYHRRTHAGLQALSPRQRYQQDLPRIRTLGQRAAKLDELFYHRLPRKVRKDGTVAYQGQRFQWLLESPGVGLLTGPAGVGKTAALRQLTQTLNPHRYQVIYLAETDFGRLDIYRGLALALGVEPAYRRAQLWRDIKARILELADGKQILPLWIIDEAQNLPSEFFRDFPAFLNFAFDSRDLMSVWLVGYPALARTLDRAPYAALASRIQARVQLEPITGRESFSALIEHALQAAGCGHTLLADSGMELLRQASLGLPRHAGRILKTAMQMAVPKGLNHLPDELLQQAIEELR